MAQSELLPQVVTLIVAFDVLYEHSCILVPHATGSIDVGVHASTVTSWLAAGLHLSPVFPVEHDAALQVLFEVTLVSHETEVLTQAKGATEVH